MTSTNPKSANEVEDFLNEMAKEVQVKTESKNKTEADDLERSPRNNGVNDERSDRRGDRYDHRPRYPQQRELNGERPSSREGTRRDGSRARSNKDADTEEDRARNNRRSSSFERRRGDRGDRRAGGRGGDYYNGGGGGRRDRTRSPRRDRDRDYRGRGDRGYRERSRDRRLDRDDNRRGGPRRRTPTPEASEDDRDKRTIFVQQISQRAETRHLLEFFRVVGPVIDAQIVKDRVTGRSKGVGYVEFKDVDSVAKALELTGQKLKGVPIIAQLTEAEKNRASRVTAGENGPVANNSGAPFHRLYVGNVHFSVTEDDLREIFEGYGELEQITLQRDDESKGNRSKGYGFVQFVDPAHAKKALADLNGFDLAGRQIRLGLGNDKFTPESTAHLLRQFPAHAKNYQGSAFSGAGGRGAHAGGGGGVFDRAHGRDERGGVSGASALDDTDMAGVNFKQVDRNKLMAALARNEVDIPTMKNTPVVPQARASTMPQASKCIKIENAFNPDEELKENGVNWMKDLEVDVKTECCKKYGNVVHIAVDPNSDGDIYVKFDSVTGGEKALQGLNGRNFNLRTIRASYVIDKIYESLYGAAASKF